MLRPDTLALTWLLALLTAAAPLSTDMYLPSLPQIERTFGADAAAVQLTLSIFLVGFALGQILYGPISDRLGRKPVLMAALLLFVGSSLACALVPTITTLLLARGLQALGGSGAIVLARAIVRDLYSGPRAGRELSVMGAIMGIAPVIAPLIGGVLQAGFGWRSTFLALAAFGMAVMFIAWRWLPETLSGRSAEPVSPLAILGIYRSLAAHREFLVHVAIVAVSYAGLFAWISGSAFVLQGHYGLKPFQFGVAFAICSVGNLIGTALATRLVVPLGLNATIGTGALALAAGGSIMPAMVALGSTSVASLVLPMLLYLVGLGLAMPQAIAAALSPFPDRAGSASSFVGFVQQTSAAAIGALVGHLLGPTAWPLAIPIAITGCLSLGLWAASRQVRTT